MAMVKHRKVGEKVLRKRKGVRFCFLGRNTSVWFGEWDKLLAWPTLVNFAVLNQLPRRF